MSEDPLGFAGGLNRYTYAGNDPINWLDYRGTARELPGCARGVIGGLSAIGGMIGIIDGGIGGGGLGLLGGPAAPVTVPLGAIAGAAAAGAEGATAGAALGFGIVLLFDDPSGLFQQASSSGGSGSGSPKIAWGKQGRHIPGSPNYDPGRSTLTYGDPQSLIDRFAGTGQPIGKIPRGQPGFKERVDFGVIIGL